MPPSSRGDKPIGGSCIPFFFNATWVDNLRLFTSEGVQRSRITTSCFDFFGEIPKFGKSLHLYLYTISASSSTYEARGRNGRNYAMRSSPTWHSPLTSMKNVDDANRENTGNTPSSGVPQCRICFDGPDQELGRLIRPCLCKGSVSVSFHTDYRQSHLYIPFPFSLLSHLARPCQVPATMENYLRF